jgi:phage-related protein
MAEEVGVGYVRLIPSARGFAKTAAKELKSGLANPSRDAGREAGDAIGEEGQPAGDKFATGFSAGVKKGAKSKVGSLGKALGTGFGDEFNDGADRSLAGSSKRFAGAVLGPLKNLLTSGAKPLAAAAAGTFVISFLGQVAVGLASGGKKIAAGLGAGLALLPAIALTGGLALATVKIGLAGISDAFKEVGSSTEDFEEAIKGLAPPARDFMREVRDLRPLLKGLKNEVQGNLFGPLVDNVKPLGERYLPVVRQALGDIATAIGNAGSRSAGFLAQPDTAVKLAGAMFNARDAIQGVVNGLPNLVRALVPVVSVGSTFLPRFSEGFRSLTARIAEAAREGEKTGAIRDFIQRGIDAVKGLIETGGTLVSIFQNVGSIGRSVFDAIGLKTGNILGTVDRLTGSFDRWLKSAEGAKALSTVFGAIRTALGGFRDNATQVAKLAGKVLGPLVPPALRLFKALVKLKTAVLGVALEALEPVIMAIGKALGFVLPLLAGFAEWLARNKPVLQGIGIAILTMLVPAFVAWAISAGAAAIATLVAMAPLIAIGIAIAALAALVIIHFDTIKRWISNVFNWVKDNWPLLLAILTGPFGLAVLLIKRNWETIKEAASGALNWVRDRWNDLVGFVKGIPGRISEAASGMWDGIKDAFRSVINTIIGWWNGISFKLPTIRIPGFDPPGPGSWGGATIGGNSFNTPNIPTLHEGGTFRTAIPGGEGLALLQDKESVLTPEQLRVINSGAAATGAQLRIDIAGGEGEFMRWLRGRILAGSGGNVQRALGA